MYTNNTDLHIVDTVHKISINYFAKKNRYDTTKNTITYIFEFDPSAKEQRGIL